MPGKEGKVWIRNQWNIGTILSQVTLLCSLLWQKVILPAFEECLRRHEEFQRQADISLGLCFDRIGLANHHLRTAIEVKPKVDVQHSITFLTGSHKNVCEKA